MEISLFSTFSRSHCPNGPCFIFTVHPLKSFHLSVVNGPLPLPHVSSTNTITVHHLQAAALPHPHSIHLLIHRIYHANSSQNKYLRSRSRVTRIFSTGTCPFYHLRHQYFSLPVKIPSLDQCLIFKITYNI